METLSKLSAHPKHSLGRSQPALCRGTQDDEGPRLVCADGTESVYLADMTGDGLADIVRVRNGSICYGPNLGYEVIGHRLWTPPDEAIRIVLQPLFVQAAPGDLRADHMPRHFSTAFNPNSSVQPGGIHVSVKHHSSPERSLASVVA